MPKSKRCVINFARGGPFIRGQKRLVESLHKVGFTGDILTWNDEETLDCPLHKQTPYAFKPATFMRAKEQGYTSILWVDSSFWAIKSIDGIFKHIEKNGYLMQFGGHFVGNWCSDKALATMGIAREKAMKLGMFMAGGFALNLQNKIASSFLARWHRRSIESNSPFKGAWSNKDSKLSPNKKVWGHRHDMAIGSIIAHKLKMRITKPHQFLAYKSTVTYLKNTNQMDDLCMLCQGML